MTTEPDKDKRVSILSKILNIEHRSQYYEILALIFLVIGVYLFLDSWNVQALTGSVITACLTWIIAHEFRFLEIEEDIKRLKDKIEYS